MTAEKKAMKQLSPESVELIIKRLDKETNIQDDLLDQIAKLLRYAEIKHRTRESQLDELLRFVKQMTKED